jgi:hypothetical protein
LLSAREFAAISSAGFDPVGHVLGTTVVHLGYVGRAGRCSGTPSYTPRTDLAVATGGPFSLLLQAGWVLAALVFGISLGARRDDTRTSAQTRRTTRNGEVRSYAELVKDPAGTRATSWGRPSPPRAGMGSSWTR